MRGNKILPIFVLCHLGVRGRVTGLKPVSSFLHLKMWKLMWKLILLGISCIVIGNLTSYFIVQVIKTIAKRRLDNKILNMPVDED